MNLVFLLNCNLICATRSKSASFHTTRSTLIHTHIAHTYTHIKHARQYFNNKRQIQAPANPIEFQSQRKSFAKRLIHCIHWIWLWSASFASSIEMIQCDILLLIRFYWQCLMGTRIRLPHSTSLNFFLSSVFRIEIELSFLVDNGLTHFSENQISICKNIGTISLETEHISNEMTTHINENP